MSMRTILIVCLALLTAVALNGCAYKHINEDNWVYFEDWDTNGDSKLDTTEFVSGYVSAGFFEEDRAKGVTASATAEESAKTLFQTCDQNEDGLVSGLEFYQWEVNRDVPAKGDSAI